MVEFHRFYLSSPFLPKRGKLYLLVVKSPGTKCPLNSYLAMDKGFILTKSSASELGEIVSFGVSSFHELLLLNNNIKNIWDH